MAKIPLWKRSASLNVLTFLLKDQVIKASWKQLRKNPRRFMRNVGALAFGFHTNPLMAQTFPKPTDVADPIGLAPLYKTDSSSNTPVDSTVTPMAIGTGLTNIAIPSSTGRLGSRTGDASNYCVTTYNAGSCQEGKLRTLVDFGFFLPDDPIRNAQQPGQSHLHCFFGSKSTNAYSTYSSLRKHGLNSTAAGTDANATGYWYPCVVVLNPYANGKNYVVKPDYIVVYYVTGSNGIAEYQAGSLIPVGLRYVFGFEMDAASVSTQYAWLQSTLDTANATVGHTRYTLTHSGRYYTQATYNCQGAGISTADVIVNSDGSDPHGGTCTSGMQYFIKIVGASCYNGKDLWSAGGYKHLIPRVYDNDKNQWVCPYNYYLLPELTLEIQFTQYGWTDRQRWVLSSDLSYRTAKGLNATTLPAGTTFHTDWMYGWDSAVFNQGQRQCIGAEHNMPHECNGSQFSSTQYLIGGVPGELGAGGRNPQVDTASIAHVNESDPGWGLIPSAWSGGLTGQHIRADNTQINLPKPQGKTTEQAVAMAMDVSGAMDK